MRAGCRVLIIPKDNEKEYLELPQTIRRQLEVHLVETMDEVLDLALVGGRPGESCRNARKTAAGKPAPGASH
jgi:ATP-dependent Lon protease